MIFLLPKLVIVHTCLFGTVSQCVSQKKFLHMFNTAFLLFFCFSLAVLQLQTIALLIAAIFTPRHLILFQKRKLFCFVLVTCSRKVTLLCTSFHFLPPFYCFDLFSLVVLTFFGNISRIKHATKMIEIWKFWLSNVGAYLNVSLWLFLISYWKVCFRF